MTFASVFFNVCFYIAGGVLAHGLHKIDFRKDPDERFWGGLMLIGLASAILACLTGEIDLGNQVAFATVCGFIIHAPEEHAPRAREASASPEPSAPVTEQEKVRELIV